MTTEDIKIVLEKIIETVDRLADETAELVDHYQRQRIAKEFQQDVIDRVNALTGASRNMRLAASTLLGIPDRQAQKGEAK